MQRVVTRSTRSNAQRRFAQSPLGLVIALAAGLAAPSTGAADPQEKTGVLVELFTSQGCYSCPPADALLGRMAEEDGVVALSLNVDYWDYLGWEDPLAKPAHTARQRAYVNAHGERSPFTPHMVLGGVEGRVGSREKDVRRAFDLARAAITADAPTIDLTREANGLAIDIKGVAAGRVLLAPYRQAVTQDISAGENRGKRLTYVNAAIEVRDLGGFEGGAASYTAQLPASADGVAVWVQQTHRTDNAHVVGPVLNAASLEF